MKLLEFNEFRVSRIGFVVFLLQVYRHVETLMGGGGMNRFLCNNWQVLFANCRRLLCLGLCFKELIRQTSTTGTVLKMTKIFGWFDYISNSIHITCYFLYSI